jgi:hypothetical protein
VPSDLPPGATFWRVRARAGDGSDVSSATWVFRVAHRRGGADTSWLEGWDANGDGLDDIPLGWFGAFAYGATAPADVVGQAAALDGAPCSYDMARPSCLALGELAPAGDVDGDGFADALARVAFDGLIRAPDGASVVIEPHVLLFRGRETGDLVPTDSSVCVGMTTAIAIGDTDGDGFADVAVACGDHWRVYRGSQSGLLATTGELRAPVVPALDVDDDGLPDVLTGDGLALGTHSGFGLPTDISPVILGNVVGAIARPDGEVDFAARVGARVTPWRPIPGQASLPRGSTFMALSSSKRETFAVLGDVDGDGFDDAAEGHDEESGAAGWVRVIPGGPHAPREPRLRWIDDPLVSFGRPVAVGDFNGDGFDDLEVRAVDDSASYALIYLGGPRGVASKAALVLGVQSHP